MSTNNGPGLLGKCNEPIQYRELENGPTSFINGDRSVAYDILARPTSRAVVASEKSELASCKSQSPSNPHWRKSPRSDLISTAVDNKLLEAKSPTVPGAGPIEPSIPVDCPLSDRREFDCNPNLLRSTATTSIDTVRNSTPLSTLPTSPALGTDPNDDLPNPLRPFSCKLPSTKASNARKPVICGRDFKRQKDLKRHEKDCHPTSTTVFYRCCCGKEIQRRDNYLCHVGKCTKQFAYPTFRCKCQDRRAGKEEHIGHVKGCQFNSRRRG